MYTTRETDSLQSIRPQVVSLCFCSNGGRQLWLVDRIFSAGTNTGDEEDRR